MIRSIIWNGLWKQNSGLIQLLGMCPVLAMTGNVVSAAGIGCATIVVMALSNFAVSLLRIFIPYEIRIPVYILIMASLVTVVDLSMNALVRDLYLVLGIFIPLIVTNCLVLARLEAFASKNPPLLSALDGAMMGLGLTLVLVALGAIREFVGTGMLFAGIEMMIPGAHEIKILPDSYPGFLIAILPPGAFFTLGFLVALRNWIDARSHRRALQKKIAASAGVSTPVTPSTN